ncbi:hypothetical protein [Streptomyces indiaensis]|nr:hypothetical protein [Streptomyces indiaensis]MCF1648669.1 hypothetical protein [Streptomyces indiaensis]
MSELSTSTRSMIVDRARRGEPIWTFDSGYNPSLAGEDFALMGQAWLDLELAYRILFDASKVPTPLRWSPDDAMSSAISDAWRAAACFPGMLPHPGNDIADHIYRGNVYLVAPGGVHLTTRSLWECASTLDEIRASATGADEEALAELRRMAGYKLQDPVYGGPWKVANEITHGINTVAMFLVAVHIATNPPLPYWDHTVTDLSWDDLYPPSRFMKVYKFLHDNRFFREFRTFQPDDYDDVIDAIIQGSGIKCASALGEDSMGLDLYPGVRQALVGDLNAVIKSGLFLRSAWAGHPSRFILPSKSEPIMTMPDSDESKRFHEVEAASHPPFLQFAGKQMGVGMLTDEQGHYYCIGAWSHNTLDQLIRGNPIGDHTYLLDDLRGFDEELQMFHDLFLADAVVSW